MKRLTLKLEDILFDPENYPRVNNFDWMTVARYTDAMSVGDKFPPLVVVKDGNKYVLLDGWHRYQAAEALKLASFDCEIVKVPRKKWLVYAVNCNIENARPLSSQDRAQVAYKLKEAGFTTSAISKVLRAKPDTIVKWLGRVVLDKDGKPVPLKSAVSNVAGTRREELTVAGQGPIANASVYRSLDEMLALLEVHAIDVSIQLVRTKVENLVMGLGKLLK